MDNLPILNAIDELLLKLLGPTADEVGEVLATWTAYRLRNLKEVAQNAKEKAGDGSEGYASPRVAMKIFEDASYSDDDVIVSYLGGVLASSYTPIGRDDRGVYWSSLVSTLSTYALRAHYICYRELRRLLRGQDLNFGIGYVANECSVYIPDASFLAAMEFAEDENGYHLLDHALSSIEERGLIGRGWGAYATVESARESRHTDIPEPGIIFPPTPRGAELFLWAHGRSEVDPTDLLLSGLELVLGADIPQVRGARLATEMEFDPPPEMLFGEVDG